MNCETTKRPRGRPSHNLTKEQKLAAERERLHIYYQQHRESVLQKRREYYQSKKANVVQSPIAV